MFNYFLLCFISILTGKGILKILRIPLATYSSIFLAPVITFSFWTLFLGWGILLGFPVKNLWLLGYILTLLLCLVAIVPTKHVILSETKDLNNPQRSFAPLRMTLVLLLPIITMLPYFSHGLLNYGGANAFDGWSYTANGQYLWENMRGSEGNLIPLYQYAAHLSHSRFIGSALLAFFSPFIHHPGDTQAAENLLLAWAIFNFASACAFFISTQKINRFVSIYLTLVIFSGWTIGLLSVNNFDNALILSLLPAFAGIVSLLKNENKRIWSVILAMLVATTILCIVELAPFILGGFAILLFMQINQNKKAYLSLIPLLILFSFILLLPYRNEIIPYFFRQLHDASQAPGLRPGEGFFHSLLEPKLFFTAFWGSFNNSTDYILGIFFTLFTILGLITLWREKQYGLPILCLLLLVGVFDLIVLHHYSYGAYKLILLNWWLLMFCVITGVNSLLINQRKYKMIFTLLLSLIGISYLISTYHIEKYYAKQVLIKDIAPYRLLSLVNEVADNKAILVNINNDMNNIWAVYFMRNTSIKLVAYRAYMAQPHLAYYMNRAKQPNNSDIQYLLTDNSKSLPIDNLVWFSEPYYLWKLP